MTNSVLIKCTSKCSHCSGNKYLKTPHQEDYPCHHCQGKGEIKIEGEIIENDDDWDDLLLIKEKTGTFTWLFKDLIIEKKLIKSKTDHKNTISI